MGNAYIEIDANHKGMFDYVWSPFVISNETYNQIYACTCTSSKFNNSIQNELVSKHISASL